MIDRKAKAQTEAKEMCWRARRHGYLATRRVLYGGSTRAFTKRQQRIKAIAIHLLTKAGVIALSMHPMRPCCSCGGCREKQYNVSREKLDAYLA